MYRKQIICTIVVLTLTFCAGIALTKTRSVTLRVKGMTCGGCATSVESALKSTEGVEDAQVSYKRGTAIVKYDDQKVTVAKLREVVNSAGFTCELPESDTR
ncbi:MAG: heavy-metal-associated domain-containing protein [Pyrinomonadaceae bacterium]